MKRNWRLLNPEEMTPEEREEGVIEIIAQAVARIIIEEGGPKNSGSFSSKPIDMKKLFPEKKRFFRPRRGSFGRPPKNQSGDIRLEAIWIDLIKGMRLQGISMRKIAKHLNSVDKTSRYSGTWSGTVVWRILKRLLQHEAKS